MAGIESPVLALGPNSAKSHMACQEERRLAEVRSPGSMLQLPYKHADKQARILQL